MNKNILVTAIGSMSADAVIKKLKEAGNRVIGCEIYDRKYIANSLLVDGFYNVPYFNENKEYIDSLIKICREESIDYLIPLTDDEVDVLNMNREKFEEINITLCISPSEVIKLCRNKYLINEFIKKHGIVKTIETIKFNDFVNQYQYPLICKKINGRSSQGLRIIKNFKDLEDFKLETDNLENYIIQPFVEGNVVTVDVIASKNRTVAIPRKEYLRTSNGAGLSVCVYKDKELQNKCIELATKLGIFGCVNFEFINDKNGNYYFLECNPRFSGGVSFSCLAGYNCVINHIRCFENAEIDDFEISKEMYIAKKYQEYITSID